MNVTLTTTCKIHSEINVDGISSIVFSPRPKELLFYSGGIDKYSLHEEPVGTILLDTSFSRGFYNDKRKISYVEIDSDKTLNVYAYGYNYDGPCCTDSQLYVSHCQRAYYNPNDMTIHIVWKGDCLSTFNFDKLFSEKHYSMYEPDEEIVHLLEFRITDDCFIEDPIIEKYKK